MDIFESLENLNVSEACLSDIINIVEEIINELKDKDAFETNQKRQVNLDRARDYEEYIKKYSLNKKKHYDAEDAVADALIKRNNSDRIYNAWKKAKKKKGKLNL